MSRIGHSLRRFQAELTRRRVHRVVVAYAAGAWVVLQVADVGLPALGVGEGAMTALVVATLLGFPLALGLAWFFDLTPGGLERTDPMAEPLVDGASASLVSLAVVVTISLVAVGSAAYYLTIPRATEVAAESTPDRWSIAVLPFEDRSLGSGEASFIASGLHDDLLTQLSRVSSLRVISRTSVLGYRDTTMRLPDIARELGVGTIVAGGVSQTGDRLRMNIQLIDAQTDESLWSQTFDRHVDLDSIFDLQAELVEQIANALTATLTPEERRRIQEIPTDNLEAYNFFIRGNEYFQNRLLEEPMRHAIDMYRAATELDPEFALAHARLAEVRSLYYARAQPSDSIRSQALASVDRARTLQPDLDEAALADGYFRYWVLGDLQSARESFESVLPRQPSNAELHWLLGSVYRRLGDLDVSTDHLAQASALDPRSPIYHGEASVNFAMADQPDEALRHSEQALALAPAWLGAYLNNSILHARFGDQEAARAIMREALQRFGPAVVLSQLTLTPYRLHLRVLGPEFQDQLLALRRDELQANPAQIHLTLGRLRQLNGEEARAQTHFDSARVMLEASAQARPGEPAFTADLALAYVGLGRNDDAIRAAVRATDLRPVSRDPIDGYTWLMNLLGVQLQAERYADAVRTLERARTLPFRPSRFELEQHPWFAGIQEYEPFQALLTRW